MDFFEVVVRFFQEGGAFMFPIAVVLAMGLAISIERYFFLSFSKRVNKKAFKQMEPLLNKHDYTGVLSFASSDKAPISRIIGAGMARLNHSQRREDIEYAMEEGLMETTPRLEKRTAYLATLANISTLLGLLGTIIGLIAAFESVANADPAEKASQLSSSISIAMNTTAFGLMAAIPLLFLHAILQNKTTDIIDGLEMASVKCLNMMSRSQTVSTQTRESDK